MKRVLVDQGSGAKIMYADLYKWLNLKPENLTAYDSPLGSFDGKVVIPRGQIRMPVQAGFRSSGGGLHCGGCIFSLHGHCGKTLALCPRGHFFNFAFEGEIFVGGLD